MICAIIQARMGSIRLPNKVMKEVLNKPLIDYLLERVVKAQRVDKIILATTTNLEDDDLAEHVGSLGYDVFRGSENDVLSRYYHAFSLPLNTSNTKNRHALPNHHLLDWLWLLK
jgi:spore coat polysaccharide biosynthesis protein SpsF (cytidylyltransferase family)